MSRYHVDARGRIPFVDEAWCAFAAENAAPQYADPAFVYGVPLLSCISDPTTRQIYATLMERVTAEQIAIRVPFRCDAPSQQRWMELEMAPRPNRGIAFASHELRTEAQAPVLAFDRPATTDDVLVRMCSWCKKVEVTGGQWLLLDLAVRRLGLFGSGDVPLITHGICPPCTRQFESGAGFPIEPA